MIEQWMNSICGNTSYIKGRKRNLSDIKANILQVAFINWKCQQAFKQWPHSDAFDMDFHAGRHSSGDIL